jgi:glucose/arabinose dehydrogenase
MSRQMRHGDPTPAWGASPTIPEARPQGAIPTLKMPTARGWDPGQTPTAAAGLKVNAFATDLDHPRWIYVLPNGDVLIAESSNVPRQVMRSVFDYAMVATMRRARAVGVSANRITAPGRLLVSFKPGGHWTRSILPSPDGSKLYLGVGSSSNIADNGMEEEEGRALIYEYDIASSKGRTFAGGLRNAVGMTWEPVTGALWTVVNERDGLGDETPPDYLTSVRDGGFYGWPYCYWDRRRRPGAAGPSHGGEGAHAGLCAGRPHRVIGPLLAAGRHAARPPGRHGDRSARVVEPCQAERL